MQESKLILDYEEFRVYYDTITQTFVYVDMENFHTTQLELIATLRYDINSKMQWFADFEQIFLDTFCSGERITDNEITYYWFKEIEE